MGRLSEKDKQKQPMERPMCPSQNLERAREGALSFVVICGLFGGGVTFDRISMISSWVFLGSRFFLKKER